MERRDYLIGVAALGASASSAGCTGLGGGGRSGQSTTRPDSDDDGVPDGDDYAPSDPDVQSKSDVEAASTTAIKATTGTATRTTSTTITDTTSRPTTDASASIPSNTLQASYEPLLGRTSYFKTYGFTESTVTVNPATLEARYSDGAKLVVYTFTHPSRETAFAVASSKRFSVEDRTDPFEVTASSVETAVPDDRPVYNIALLIPGDLTLESAETSDFEKLCESNRYRVEAARAVKDPHPASLESVETDTFARNAGEGTFILDYSGTTRGRDWQAGYVIHKSIYVERLEEPRGRSRKEYAEVAQNGFSETMGRILIDEAESNGFVDKREQAAFLIDFVQNLPYVTDDVSKGYDDYTKFVVETLTEGNGDCEDTAILLATLLQSTPFDYDAVLLLYDDHMAVGVYGEDLPGYYYDYDGRRYYYLESTGEDWGVGDIPDTYEGERARVIQV